MLMVERRYLEDVRISLPDGREIRITLVSIGRHAVRLGISAPAEIGVHRPERDSPRPRPGPGARGLPGPDGLPPGPVPAPGLDEPSASEGPARPALPPGLAQRWRCGRLVDLLAVAVLVAALPLLIVLAPVLAADGRSAGVVR